MYQAKKEFISQYGVFYKEDQEISDEVYDRLQNPDKDNFYQPRQYRYRGKGDYKIEFSGFLSPTTLHKGYFPMQYPSDAPTQYYFDGILYTLEAEDAL